MTKIIIWPTWHDTACTRQRENGTNGLDSVIENLCEAEDSSIDCLSPYLSYGRVSMLPEASS